MVTLEGREIQVSVEERVAVVQLIACMGMIFVLAFAIASA